MRASTHISTGPHQSETTRLLSQNLNIARDNESAGTHSMHSMVGIKSRTDALHYIICFVCSAYPVAANAIIDELNSQGETLITTQTQVRCLK